MGEVIQDTWYTIFKLFLIVVLVAFGLYFSTETPLKNITKAYLEIGCTRGGFSNNDIEAMKDELAKNGFEKDKIIINAQPTTGTYVNRGELMYLNVEYNKLGPIDNIFKRLGITSDTKNKCILYGMSEKIS